MSEAAAPLPRGRHNLTRDQVEASQRLRLAVGLTEALGAQGYAGTSVAAILSRAGVSRLTFYELYDNKLDCFLDALDLVGEVLLAGLRSSFDRTDGDPVARAGAVIDRYLTTLSENLGFARLYIVEVNAAGPAALARRAALQRQVVDALADLVGARDADDRFACECFVAAVSALVTLPVATGDTTALRQLGAPLTRQLRRLIRDAG